LRIICIGAHPDDVELSMGGTILKLQKSHHEILLVDLTNGEPTPFGDPETRKKESTQAADILGVSRITLQHPNRYLQDSLDVRKDLARVFRDFKPELIFTHYEFDVHPDHKAASSLTEAARFYSKLTKSDIPGEPFFPPKILYYFPNHVHIQLLPSFCVDITDYIETKEKVLKTYESQFIKSGKSDLLDEFFETNRYYGIRIGTLFAEPFYSRETININYFSKLFST
jgi:bacillithiol biosynthesis deacetylase BshB1